MPTPLDALLGLVVVALAVLTFVVALGLSDQKNRLISFILSGVIGLLGLYYYGTSEIRGFQMRRRIESVQRQQQLNLEEIQKRLNENKKTQ